MSTDGKACAEETLELLGKQRESVYFITNLLFTTLSFDDILGGSDLVTRQLAIFQHPNMREGIVVTQSRMIELAARGLSSDLFGHTKLRGFKTLDEALAFAREAVLH